MTFVPHTSFYVTLMSHASTKEFPGNKPHQFRNRLPKPIRFMGKGWMVGLVSLSLPTIPIVAETFIGNAEPLLYVRWYEHDFKIDDWGSEAWWYEQQEWTARGQDMKKAMASSPAGSHFLHQLIYRYQQERAKRIKPKDKWVGPDGIKMYPTFEWSSEGDLLLNTKQVSHMSWGKNLALKMGWIEQVSPGTYRLGPNLLPEFDGMSTIPIPSDVRDASNKPIFWKVEGDYLKLSLSCP